MNVTPMSMQMVVPQANEASQVQHNLNQAGAVQQDFGTLRQKEDDKLKQKQVRNKDQAEDGRIQGDGGHGGRAFYAKRGKHNRDSEDEVPEQKLAEDPSRGHHLDISF